jgi:hypothetical protein
MTHSPLTNEIRLSEQSSSRNGATVDTVLWHHLAGTDAERAVNDMISGADGGSANYVITNEGKLILVVDEDLRAHSAGDPDDGGKGAAWDRRSIAVEIENETAGPDWRISDAALNTAAALLNDLRKRYSIARAIGHRDLYTAEYGFASYPTYCPGPGTVAEIQRRSTTQPTKEKEDMPILELARPKNRPEVFWVVDRSQRHHVPSEAVLKNYLFFLREHGYPAEVKVVESIESFGVDITPKSVVRAELTPETIAAVVAAVADELDAETAA